MPETVGEAFVAIRPDSTGFGQKLESSISPGLAGIGKVIGGLFAAQKVTAFFGDAIAEAEEAAKVGAQTEAVLKSTGQAAHVSAGQIDDYAQSVSDKAAIDDEAVQSAENLLLTFTKVRNEQGKGNDIFKQAVGITADLAVALGTDLNGAALQLGKALNDPVLGVTALRRAGVQLTEQQTEQIRVFVESGDILSAQKVILRELTTQVGGSAAAQATDLAKAGVAWANFKESVGTALAPLVSFGANAGVEALTFIGSLVDNLGGFVAIAPAVAAGVALIGASFVSVLGPIGLVTAAALGVVLMLNKLGIIGSAEIPKIIDPLEKVAAVIKRIDQGSLDNAVAEFDRLVAAGEKADRELRGKLKDVGLAPDTIAQISDSGRAFAYFVRVANDSPAAAQKIIDGMDRSGDATGNYERALANIIAKKKSDKEATDAQTDANENLIKSVQDIHDQTIALQGGQIGYEQAVRNVEKATTAYNGALLIFGENSDEARDAALDLASAQNNATSAANDLDKDTKDLNDTFGNSPAKIQAEIDKLEEAKRLHPEIAASYDPIIAQLQGMIWLIALIPPEKKTTVVVDASITPQAQAVLDAVAGLSPQQISDNRVGLGFLGLRASGGPVGPGAWLVGEQGPELLTLGSGASGQVTNATQTAEILGKAGPSITNHFHISAVTDDPVRLAVDAANHQKIAMSVAGF